MKLKVKISGSKVHDVGYRVFLLKHAMNLALRFAFDCLNLRRVNLDVFEYNQRAYLSYIKCGFKEEGRMRQWMQRGGERFDLIFMGILREEWEARQKENQTQVEQT